MRRRTARYQVQKFVIGTYVRNFVFGVEDSLVSTVGLLSGIASSGAPRQTIIVSGIVLIFVEAFSMGIGTVLSEQSEEEFLHHKNGKTTKSITNGIIMFTSYAVAGFIPMTPYLLFVGYQAFWLSIIFSVLALSLLGIGNGLLFGVNVLKSALKMSVLGGFAIAVGVVIGQLLTVYR